MRTSILIFVLASIGQNSGIALTAATPNDNAKLSLLVYDFTQLDSAMLQKAENETSRILAGAGLRAIWHHCTVSPAPPDPGCEAALGTTAVVLKILPRSMARPYSRKTNELGFTAQPADGGFALHAMIFFDRVQDLAHSSGRSERVLLAHTMAHEIGHALLGMGSHSRQGIMKDFWGPREIRAAAQGRLSFSSGEAARMRSRLTRRHQARRSSERLERVEPAAAERARR